ncbi:MAG: hypothetical protein D6812_16320, partial [Deltaproteobacteria bacterium]
MDDAFDDLLPPRTSRPSLPERLDAWTYLLFKGIVLVLLFALLGWLAVVLPPPEGKGGGGRRSSKASSTVLPRIAWH